LVIDRDVRQTLGVTSFARDGRKWTQSGISDPSRYRWFVAMARVREAEDDPEAAAELLDQAERLYLRGFFPEVRPIAAMKARIRIAQGKLSEAGDWARQRGVSATDDLSYLREFDHLTLVRLLIGRYRVQRDDSPIREAVGLLRRLLEAAARSRRTGKPRRGPHAASSRT
jgi:LuxR family transcriptional regulator, maltose regulon positive regulatory protein